MRSPGSSKDVDADCDCIICSVHAAGCLFSPGLPGSSQRRDQEGGEGIEAELLLWDALPLPLLLVLFEQALGKNTDRWDVLQGELSCALLVSAAKEGGILHTQAAASHEG